VRQLFVSLFVFGALNSCLRSGDLPNEMTSSGGADAVIVTVCQEGQTLCGGACSFPPPAELNTGVCTGMTKRCEGGLWVPPSYELISGYGEESCDQLDNDCDGRIDEELINPPRSTLQEGVCAGSVQRCAEGRWQEPDYSLIPDYHEPDDLDGIDNDCDGAVDEDQICACMGTEVEAQVCGACGVRERTCQDGCAWGEWGSCDESSGECIPGDRTQRSCGDSAVGACRMGVQYKTCTSECRWGPWEECEGAVYPSPELCGNLVDEDCNGVVERNLDVIEQMNGSNDTCRTCYRFNFNLNQETTRTINRYIEGGSIDSVGDEDYYCFIYDDSIETSRRWLSVELTEIPAGHDYDIYLYQALSLPFDESAPHLYDSCEANNYIASSTRGSNEDDILTWQDRGSGQDDTGLYILKVVPVDEESYSCNETYKLKFRKY